MAEAPGEALPDDQILNLIALKLKDLYASDPGPFPDPIRHLKWDYGKEIDIEKVAQEINGYAVEDVRDAKGDLLVKKGELLKTFGVLAL